MRQLIWRFRRDTHGVTSIEYAVIAGCLSVAIVGALSLISSNLNSEFAKPLVGLS